MGIHGPHRADIAPRVLEDAVERRVLRAGREHVGCERMCRAVETRMLRHPRIVLKSRPAFAGPGVEGGSASRFVHTLLQARAPLHDQKCTMAGPYVPTYRFHGPF